MFALAILAIALLSAPAVESAKILVICPFMGKSHSVFVHPIVLSLAEKGHELTVITSNLIENAPSNVKQIHSDTDFNHRHVDPSMMYNLDRMPSLVMQTFVYNLMVGGTEQYLNSTNVQKFIREDNTKFDIVLAELFFHEAFYTFAYKYQVPLVLLGTSSHFHQVDDVMGNPSTLSYLSHELSRLYGDLSLLQRVHNFITGSYGKYIYKWCFIPKHERMQQEYFPNLPKPIPSIRELEKNVTLVLFNTHFSFDAPRPLVPGIVEVGGLHLKPPKKLPEDLQKFLDGAKDGFIYFSLGSNLKSSAMSQEKKEGFLTVFSRLKQRVLWKFEDESLTNLPDNVKISKWLPQGDLLAHPNIKMFITQTGMLSTQEAVSRGVPMIGLPILGDQHLNIAKLEYNGMGISLPWSEVTEETLYSAIEKILLDPSYSENAKKISARYNDRQNTPIETATYWIEYVLRHGTGSYLKSRLINTSWYEEDHLDVYLVLFVIIYLFCFLAKRGIRGLYRMCTKKSEPKKATKASKKHN